MRRNNHQYKVGDKILVKCMKNSKHEVEFRGPFSITQINDNGTVCFQKGIINNATNIRRIKPCIRLNKKGFYNNSCFSLKHMTMARFTLNKESSMITLITHQMITHQGLHNNISYFTFMIFRTLIIGVSAVYQVSFNC